MITVTALCVASCASTRSSERLAGEQRHVAVGHQDRAARGPLGQGVEGALGGAAGALDVVLVGDDGLRVDLGDVGGDQVALVPDDDGEVLGADGAGRGDRVAQQGPAPDPVQDLGGRGLHPGALTCGEDDDGG